MAELQDQAPEGGDRPTSGATLGSLSHETQPRRQKVLRIRITDVDTGRLKVGLSLPAGLVSVALRQGARLIPRARNGPDLSAVIDGNGLQEPLVVEDEQNGERVEISLE